MQQYTIIDLYLGGHEVLLNSNRHNAGIERRSIWLCLLFNSTLCLQKHRSTIVLIYNKFILYIYCHFGPLKLLTLRMDHAKLLDVMMSLPISNTLLPHVVCFATSRTANHAKCSYISDSGLASEPIRRCLFTYHIIITDHKSTIVPRGIDTATQTKKTIYKGIDGVV